MNEFTRAPAAYRETILHFALMDSSVPLHQADGKQFRVSRKVDVLGTPYDIDTESEYRKLRFVRLRPSDRKPDQPRDWAAYWVRGKGMKVYGNYERFEQDIVLLKTAS